jgi:hypothetical protein
LLLLSCLLPIPITMLCIIEFILFFITWLCEILFIILFSLICIF